MISCIDSAQLNMLILMLFCCCDRQEAEDDFCSCNSDNRDDHAWWPVDALMLLISFFSSTAPLKPPIQLPVQIEHPSCFFQSTMLVNSFFLAYQVFFDRNLMYHSALVESRHRHFGSILYAPLSQPGLEDGIINSWIMKRRNLHSPISPLPTNAGRWLLKLVWCLLSSL